jgi:hypothetical protein
MKINTPHISLTWCLPLAPAHGVTTEMSEEMAGA